MAVDYGWSSVPNWVIRSDKLQGTEKWVYITLLNRANSRGECWPSLATLQKEVGVSKNTVLKTLRSLESKGLIKRVQRRVNSVEYASNLYRVHAFEGGSETELGGSNENQGVVQPLNQGGSNENQEVLPIEVLPNRSTTHLSARDLEALFDEAYFSWPKKVERKKSLDKFLQASKKRDPYELAADIKRFGVAYSETTAKRYVPALNVWLNGERWTDELPEPDAPAQGQSVRESRMQSNLGVIASLAAEQKEIGR